MSFLSKLSGSLSQKQKDQAVQASLLKQWGKQWYNLPIPERQNFREQRYAELFLGAKELKETTEAPIEQQIAASDSIGALASARYDAEDMVVPVQTFGVQGEASEGRPQIEGFHSVAPIEGTVEHPSVHELLGYVDPMKLVDINDIIKAKAIADALAPTPIPYGEEIRETKVIEFIPASEESYREQQATEITEEGKHKGHETFSLTIELNERQRLAVDFARAGKCFVYTGPAGTGKTTGCREIAKILLAEGSLQLHDFKVRGSSSKWMGPSIAFVAYTNRASNNMRRALHKDPLLEQQLTGNILTIHSLLEYEPEFFDREDGSTGMRFIPMRTAKNPLRITHLVIEESSMLGIDLWLKLYEALPKGCQVIFVGDINQLPPVFSKSILNYALLTLPVVELTEVYRQALDSPIIANAHRCLKGEQVETVKPYFTVVKGKQGGKILSESATVNLLVNSLKRWSEELEEDGSSKRYDPDQDIILCPFGKENKERLSQANTTALNNHIAQFLGAKRNAMVYEVLAGIRKLYLALGDRVMIDKQDGIITRIAHNAQYVGVMPQPASNELTRFGSRIPGSASIGGEDEDFELTGYENLNVDLVPNLEDEKDKPRAASHVIDVLMDSGRTVCLSSSGDFGDSFFSLGYALTVHKAQGCEWRKVILLLHRNHATMLNRELIYTAITRAREYCVVVDLNNQLGKAIANQRIKGNTVQDKIEWFNSEMSLTEPVPVIP